MRRFDQLLVLVGIPDPTMPNVFQMTDHFAPRNWNFFLLLKN
jgi:hypothetical protein